MFLTEELWAATPATLATLRQLAEREAAMQAAGYVQAPRGAEDEKPYLLEKIGNLAVITVKGVLVNAGNLPSWARPYATSYGDIQEALVAAAQSQEYAGVLLKVSSGGGAVSGMFETQELVADVNRNYKPVIAFADGLMASAAYGVSSGSGKILASKFSTVGSIGVISTVTNVTKLYEDMGVKHYVFRSAPEKALGQPIEPMTDKIKEHIQADVDKFGDLFLSTMANARNMSVAQARDSFGSGATFLGFDAQKVGLIDGISSFGQAMTGFQGDLKMSGSTAKRTLEAQSLEAAVEAGVAADQPSQPTEAVNPEVVIEAEVVAQDGSTSTETVSVTVPDALSAVLDGLVEQLTEAKISLKAAKDETETLKAKVASLTADVDALRPLVAVSTARFRSALGLASVSMDGETVTNLVAEHARLSEQFRANFKTGGVAAVVPSSQETKAAQPVRGVRAAHLNAVRGTK